MEQQTNNKIHVAIIMDGNGRWGELQGKHRTVGHLEGAKRVKDIVRHARRIELGTLTLWAFSTDNWNRPRHEINMLMKAFRNHLTDEADELHEADIRVSFIGYRPQLPSALQNVMLMLEDKTKDNTGLHLQIALNYGGQDEIIRAVNKAIEAGQKVDEQSFVQYLDTADVSDPDLIIRTSGENRLSGFMPYQSKHSELLFVDTLWPDFREQNLDDALQEFAKRNRRFGGVQSVAAE